MCTYLLDTLMRLDEQIPEQTESSQLLSKQEEDWACLIEKCYVVRIYLSSFLWLRNEHPTVRVILPVVALDSNWSHDI